MRAKVLKRMLSLPLLVSRHIQFRVKKRVAESMLISALSYGDGVRVPVASDRNRLNSLKLAIGKRLLGCSRRTSTAAVLGDLGWLPHNLTVELEALALYHRLMCLDTDTRLVGCVADTLDRAYHTANKLKEQCKARGGMRNHAIRRVAKIAKKYPELRPLLKPSGRGRLKAFKAPKWRTHCANIITRRFMDKWDEEISGDSSSLSKLYCKVRRDRSDDKSFLPESYLMKGTAEDGAALKFKLRCGSNSLFGQLGKWRSNNCKDLAHSRMCQLCDRECIEDTTHFMLECEFAGYSKCRGQLRALATSLELGSDISLRDLALGCPYQLTEDEKSGDKLQAGSLLFLSQMWNNRKTGLYGPQDEAEHIYPVPSPSSSVIRPAFDNPSDLQPGLHGANGLDGRPKH
jgi:hypothetical protein